MCLSPASLIECLCPLLAETSPFTGNSFWAVITPVTSPGQGKAQVAAEEKIQLRKWSLVPPEGSSASRVSLMLWESLQVCGRAITVEHGTAEQLPQTVDGRQREPERL